MTQLKTKAYRRKGCRMKNAKCLMYCISAALLTSCSEGALKLDSIAALSVDKATEVLDFDATQTIVTASGGVAPYTFETIFDPTADISESWTRESANQFKFIRPWNSGTTTLRITDALGNKQDSVITLSPGGYNFVGGLGTSTVVTQVVEDFEGNFIICGTTNGILETINGERGTQDAFIAKLSPQRNRHWIRQIGTGTGQTIASPMIAVASNGDVFLAGSTTGNLVEKVTSPTAFGGAAGADNTFLLKYTSSGDFGWVKEIGGSGGSFAITQPVQLQISASNDIFIVGITDNDIAVNNIEMGLPAVSFSQVGGNLGARDTFLTKFNSVTGRIEWVIELGSSVGLSYVSPTQMKLSDDNIYILGETDGDIGDAVVDGIMDGTTLGNTSGSIRAYLAKFSQVGVPSWSNQLGGGVGKNTRPVSMRLLGDDVYAAGLTQGRIDIENGIDLDGILIGNEPGLGNTYVVKYGSNGSSISWRYQLGGGSGTTTVPTEMAVSATGVYVVGRTSGNISDTASPDVDATELPVGIMDGTLIGANPLSSTNVFLAKFTLSDGAPEWSNQLAEGFVSTGLNESSVELSVVNDGIYLAGTVDRNIILDENIRQFGIAGDYNSYVLKYNLDGDRIVWSGQIGASLSTAGLKSLLIDRSENPFLLGTFSNRGLVTGSMNPDVSIGSENSFLIKLNSIGEMQ